MKKEERKKHKQEYQQNSIAMGVFLIRNRTNDKVFMAAGRDLQGIINRHRFQLTTGAHPNKSLQSDWINLGAASFEFEILEELVPPDDPRFDQKKELEFMEKLWLEKLQPFGENGYNEPRLSRHEKLRRISARNSDSR